MHSKRAPIAEAVARTITAIDRAHGNEEPQFVEKIKREALVRLSDRLSSRKAPRPKMLLVKSAPEER